MKYLNLFKHRLVRIYQSYFPQKLTDLEHEMIARNLSNPFQALFYSQPLCDQRHGLLVYNKCLQIFDASGNRPTDEELLVASCFHDVAKKDCRFNVTQRVVVATLLSLIPSRSHIGLRSSKSKFKRRVGVYVDHAELSWEFIEPEFKSDFVREATIFHHGILEGLDPDPDQAQNLELFIEADTL